MNGEIDVRGGARGGRRTRLSVVHRTGDRLASRRGRALPRGADPRREARRASGRWTTFLFVGDRTRSSRRSRSSSTGVRRGAGSDRVLATVLFTDIVGSTERAAELGDRRLARSARQRTTRSCDAQLERWRGREVDTAGDGFLATFDGPGAGDPRALSPSETPCAPLDSRFAPGCTRGEVRARRRDVAGIAVHTGARVAALAAPGEVLVSSTVEDLVAGSGHRVRRAWRARAEGRPGHMAACTLSPMADAYIVDAVRSPIGKRNGSLVGDSRRRARRAGPERSRRARRARSRRRSRTSRWAASPRSASRR